MHFQQVRCKYFPLLFLLLSCFATNAQTKGYILQGDTLYSEGYIKFDHRKPFEVKFQLGKTGQEQVLQAVHLTAFGYHDSTMFASHVLEYYGERRPVFLELLSNGQLKIYRLHGEDGKQFYLEQGGLKRLSKENLQASLQQQTSGTAHWQRQVPYVRLSNSSLSYLSRNFNKNRKARMLQYSVGAVANLSLSAISIEGSSYRNVITKDNSSMTSEHAEAGVFGEIPLWYPNNFSLIPQLTYGKMLFSESQHEQATGVEHNTAMKLEYLRMALMPRYYINANRVSFFVEGGPEAIYVLGQSIYMLRAEHSNNTTHVKEYADFFELPPVNLGFNAAVGLQLRYTARHHLSISLNRGLTFGEQFSLNNFSTSIRLNI
jgi:hypothetical protein